MANAFNVPVLLCIFLLALDAGFGAPISHFVPSLPGQPPVPFRIYSGYITIDAIAGRALFFFFAEAEENPETKPLTLWLNGGPGCSSVGTGGFTELGPFYPDSTGTGLIRNSHSWNRASNMLFVETPAGVGWSYSNTTSDYESYDDKRTAKDTVRFLVAWFKMFPEYKDRDFYMSGESYAGHYIPQLASAILKYSSIPGHYEFKLKGIVMGNPSLNAAIDNKAIYVYLWTHGLISDQTYEGLLKSCEWVSMSSIDCKLYVDRARDEVGDYINSYDVLADVCVEPQNQYHQIILMKTQTGMRFKADACIFREMHIYLNLPEVQKALHTNTTGLPYPWKTCDSGVLRYHEEDRKRNILPVVKKLLRSGLRVWIYNGDLDSVVPLVGTRKIVNIIAEGLNLQTTARYGPWYHQKQVAGWTQSYGNLTYATVRGASHMVPYGQPSRGLFLFKGFLQGVNLPSQP